MKRIWILTSIIFLYVLKSEAQFFIKTELGVKAVVDSVGIEVQFYSPSIVRIIKWPEGKPCLKESLSVIKTPQKTVFRCKNERDLLLIESNALKVILNKRKRIIVFETATGAPLLNERWSGENFVPIDDGGESSYRVRQSFKLDKEEAIYGLGIQQQGKMIQRNLKLRMIQGNTDDYVPFFQSNKGYGLFWDNYSPTIFEDCSDSTSFSSEVGGCIDYYFLYGGNADGVIAQMRDLTGQVPLLPLWTYGYWQSRERYKSQDELVGVVKKYRELGVPLDGIIQDWQYWGNNYLWNAMEFLNPEFYDSQKMIEDVHRLNAHMIISIWSSFGPETKPYRDLKGINALFNIKTWPESGIEKWPPNPDYPSGVKVYDAYNPRARDIYWKYADRGIFSLGIDGWWMDSTEPDHLDQKTIDFDTKTYLGTFRKVRNAYPLMTVGGVYQHQRAVTSEKRVFILTRSAFAGQQRYGANTWSGDVTASWAALRNQIPAGLNFSLCGLPYFNSDIGGFFLSEFPRRLDDAEYRELYVRWLQFGTFCPMMRSHGTDAPREIYQFGQKGEPIYDAIEKFINLRYCLLPYIYSTSWEVSCNRSTMMRALVMDFADDKQALDINDEYMFGRSLLVNPVTQPMYSKTVMSGNDSIQVEDFSSVKSKDIYLPKGTGWYDFWSGEKFNGGQTIKKEVPLDIIPLFVKAGTILPVGPKVQYASEKKWDNLEIRVYEGADGEFTLYEDENDNYNYEKGIYSTISFKWNDAKKTLTIGQRKGAFPGMLKQRTFHIIRVSRGKGIGMLSNSDFDKSVNYIGEKIVVKLQN
jgi:alpha-D-xyloside xylohydrolase